MFASSFAAFRKPRFLLRAKSALFRRARILIAPDAYGVFYGKPMYFGSKGLMLFEGRRTKWGSGPRPVLVHKGMYFVERSFFSRKIKSVRLVTDELERYRAFFGEAEGDAAFHRPNQTYSVGDLSLEPEIERYTA